MPSGRSNTLRENLQAREKLPTLDLDTVLTNCELERGEVSEETCLQEELGRRCYADTSNIAISNSSIAILRRLMSRFKSICIPVPDYFEYSTLCNSYKEVQRNRDWGIQHIPEGIGVLVLSNPNNPTGTYHDISDVIRETKRRNALLVVDEAYIEFVGEHFSAAPAVKDHRNLVVLRTFSKFYSLINHKVGYVVAETDVINSLGKLEPPSEEGIIAAKERLRCSNREEVMQDVLRRRKWLESILDKADCEYSASSANFLMARRAHDLLYEKLSELNIKTVDLNNTYGLIGEGWCRITVGSDYELAELKRRLEAWK